MLSLYYSNKIEDGSVGAVDIVGTLVKAAAVS